MAYFDKDAYAGKREWAAKNNAAQSEIAQSKGMTAEQTDLIEELCSFRHKMHTDAAESIINDNSTDYQYWINEIDECGDGGIRERIFAAFNKFPFTQRSFTPTSFYDSEIDGDQDEFIDQCIDNASKNVEAINNEIEEFLREIDSQYGTEYCPTGHARSQW